MSCFDFHVWNTRAGISCGFSTEKRCSSFLLVSLERRSGKVSSLVTQCLDRIKTSGAAGRFKCGKQRDKDYAYSARVGEYSAITLGLSVPTSSITS
jgi:hypothetical protein